MQKNGWVKLHRKIEQWEWFSDSATVHFFIYCLVAANHCKKSWRGVEVGRGQFITGRKKMTEKLGISPQRLRTVIKRLKSTGEITIKSTNKFSIITVCNYDDYQPKTEDANQQINQPTNQQLTNNQPTTNQQLTTTKNEENIKNKENVKNIKKKTKLDLSLEYFESIKKDYEWLLCEMYADYIKARAEKKNYMTDKAVKMGITKLKRLIDDGNDQAKLLEKAIIGGYQDIYQGKDTSSKTSTPDQSGKINRRFKNVDYSKSIFDED